MSSSFFCRNKGRIAFTLIELLVVIAVIALLAALIFPVTSKMRENSNRTKCMSNQRQISTAILAYTADNGGFLPGPIFRSIRHPEAVAHLKTSSYISHPNWLGKYLDSPGVWRCPSNDAAFEHGGGGKLVYVLNNRQSTVPDYFFGNANAGATAEDREPKPLAAIQAADDDAPEVTALIEIWMISDIDDRNFDAKNSAGSGFALSNAPPPHSGGRVYGFFDGHSEYRPSERFPVNPE